MNNQKGISLVALIVTIIVIIILAAIVINSNFNKTIDDASFTRRVSEMTEVYDAITQRGIEHRIDENMYPYIGTALHDTDPTVVNGIKYGDGYYYIETDAQKKNLNLERVVGNYIANYENGEIISTTKIVYEGKDYYKLSDISGAVQGGSIATANGEYSEVKGVNIPILSDGMVPVKKVNDKWVATSEDDDEWYDYATGKYATIMLMDELELSTASNYELRQMTRSEINELVNDSTPDEITVQGSTFIWIPRYTYKDDGNGNIEIVYSNLIKDYTEDGYVKSSAFYFGGYNGAESDIEPNSGYVGGGVELTGIWVSKYEAGFNK